MPYREAEIIEPTKTWDDKMNDVKEAVLDYIAIIFTIVFGSFLLGAFLFANIQGAILCYSQHNYFEIYGIEALYFSIFALTSTSGIVGLIFITIKFLCWSLKRIQNMIYKENN